MKQGWTKMSTRKDYQRQILLSPYKGSRAFVKQIKHPCLDEKGNIIPDSECAKKKRE